MKNKNLGHFLSIHKHSHKHDMHLIDIAGKVKRSKEKIEGVSGQTFIFEEDQKINCCKNQYPILKIYDSVREHRPGVSYSFVLRVRSGVSTRSLVFFYDSVREHQPGVSYFPTILFGSID